MTNRQHRQSPLRTSLLVLLSLGVACGDDDNPPIDASPELDGGHDASPSDAGNDDADVVDAGHDANVEPDANIIDAGHDADVVDPTRCSTTLSPAEGGSFVELCRPDAPVRHVRIEGLLAPATHASTQIVFGFEAPPAGPQVDLEADQLRVLFYGGSTPAPPPQAQVRFGEAGRPLGGRASFLHAASTVCFDVQDGDAETAPYVVLWVEGHEGADCDDRATLTLESAYGLELSFGGATGALAKERPIYARQASGVEASPIITLFDTPALDVATTAAAGECETTWTEDTDWQPLCVPRAGRARHLRLEDVESTTNNAYFYVVVGEEAGPTGNPAPGEGKFILTGGRSASGQSWTWFRFDGSSTTQFRFPTPESESPLYTSGPSTICLDLDEDADGHLGVRFWASGVDGADCDDPTTLTSASALYESDADTDADWWAAPLAEGLSFLKVNNTAARIGRVVAYAETRGR